MICTMQDISPSQFGTVIHMATPITALLTSPSEWWQLGFYTLLPPLQYSSWLRLADLGSSLKQRWGRLCRFTYLLLPYSLFCIWFPAGFFVCFFVCIMGFDLGQVFWFCIMRFSEHAFIHTFALYDVPAKPHPSSYYLPRLQCYFVFFSSVSTFDLNNFSFHYYCIQSLYCSLDYPCFPFVCLFFYLYAFGFCIHLGTFSCFLSST